MQLHAARPEKLNWTEAPERGSLLLARFMVWLVTTLGWLPGHLLLYPIAAYFLVFSPRPRAHARAFLARALGRPAGIADLYRLYFAFASTILDRAFLVTGRIKHYHLEVRGLDKLQACIDEGKGCVLLGAHMGSFEALRAIGDSGCPVEVAVLMHEANAARLKAVFDVMGGEARSASVIPLGQPDTMLRVRECLERGGLVGLLADRGLPGGRYQSVPFLGEEAPLPTGPHVLTAMLNAPVMLAFGLWRGPRQYEIRFENFAAPLPPGRAGRDAAVTERVRLYTARLEAICREYPYNWFNFFDFWNTKS